MCLKRFDLQVAQIHQAAVRAQLELFRGKLDGFPDHSGTAPSQPQQQAQDATVSLRLLNSDRSGLFLSRRDTREIPAELV